MYVTAQHQELSGLGKFSLRKIARKIAKPVEKLAHKDPVFRAAMRVDKKVKAEIARSKIAKGIIYGAGVIAAPFTGGASLALASAAVQSSKASASGKSFGAQLVQGIGAGAIGYVAGVGLVYGAGALGVGSAAAPGQAAGFFTPFGTSGFTAAQAAAAASDAGMLYAPAVASSVSPAVSAASSAWSVGSALKSVAGGLNTAKDVFGVAALIKAARSPSGSGGEPSYFEPSIYNTGGGSASGGGSGGGGWSAESERSAVTDGGPVALLQGKTPYYIAGGVLVILTAAVLLKRRGKK